MKTAIKSISAVSILLAWFFVAGMAANAQSFSDFEKKFAEDPEGLAADTATSRATSYWLSGSTAIDTDEVNGNSYNWRKKGAATINGKLKVYTEDGNVSEDRCVSSDDPDDGELELVEHWYEYNASWGGAIKRSQFACSSEQYGTECKAGACVPVPAPPDDYIIKEVAKCKWILGDCGCPENYNSNYETSEPFCEKRTYMTWMYNALSGKWEEVKNRYYHTVDYGSHPEWIYSNEKKEAFVRAAAVFKEEPEPVRMEKPERPDPRSQCAKALVSEFGPLFESCYRQVGVEKRFDSYTGCVTKNASPSYRQKAAACGKEMLNWSADSTLPSKAPLDALMQFRLGVTKDAEKIISIKQCGGGLPSQNSCVANVLSELIPYIDESTDVISAGETYGYDGPKDQPIIIDFVDGEMPKTYLQWGWTFGALWDDMNALNIDSATPKNYKNFVVLDADVSAESKIIYEPQMSAVGQWKPLSKHLEIESSSFVVTDQKSVRLTNGSAVVEIGPQSGVYVAGSGADDTQYDLKFGAVGFFKNDDGSVIEVRTPLTITKSKHTQFVVLYDPEKQSAATAIYQGEVEVTDRLTGETVTLTPTDDGKPRVLIVPLAQATEEAPKVSQSQSQNSKGSWFNIVIFLALLGGAGFWFYEKKIKPTKI